MIKVLFLGDVVGKLGCEVVTEKLQGIKREHDIDVTIVNGENSAEGNGITPDSANTLLAAGADIITTGNHALRRRECHNLFDDSNFPIVRPLNFPKRVPGRGVHVLDMLRFRMAVINLQGKVFLDHTDNPFDAVEGVLKQIDTPLVVVDFHAEATSEKNAMGYFLDGKVSAVLGTHTHIQTSDERVLPGGTAYITDAGMCGALNSVLGVEPEQALYRLRTGLPVRFETVKQRPAIISGTVLTLDPSTGRAESIERILIKD